MTGWQIAERLHARPCGRGWIARCPAHEDRSPSLSISENGHGDVLLHCHAGCSTDKILLAAGLAWRDLFQRHERRSPEPRQVREARLAAAEQLNWLRRLPAAFRNQPVVLVFATSDTVDAAIARALALAAEGELTQVVLKGPNRDAAD